MIFYTESNVGCKRELNEDNFCALTLSEGAAYCFAVADGMGGHNAGETASKIAIDVICGEIPFTDPFSDKSVKECFYRIYDRANRSIRERASESEDYSGMGTTAVTCLINSKGMLYVANVGDSRAYLVKDGSIYQITKDHSYVEYLVSCGMIQKEDARTHPDKNIITKALGKDKECIPDIFELQMEKDDKLILCTDGLSNMIDENVIRDMASEDRTAEDICHSLVGEALKMGGSDNITAVVAVM